jgi:predicted branched-subunit amino acid permease
MPTEYYFVLVGDIHLNRMRSGFVNIPYSMFIVLLLPSVVIVKRSASVWEVMMGTCLVSQLMQEHKADPTIIAG